MRKARQRLTLWRRQLVSLAWPARALITLAPVDAPGQLETDLWRQLDFMRSHAGCPICAGLYEDDVPVLSPDQPCPACLARPPAYDLARAALRYDAISRQLILPLKHGGRRDGLEIFAGWMEAAASGHLERGDLIVPVPLHLSRLASRGFNQSLWLAAALSRRTGHKLVRDMIVRTRPTPSQAGQNARGRRQNMRAAFAIRRPYEGRIKGARIVLIDDVYTTGATVEACARQLKAAGAGHVFVLTLARVVRPMDVTI
jgi:ComF family protein